MRFAPHMDAVFRILGSPAVYTPPGGGAGVPFSAIRAVQPLEFSGVEVPVEGVCLDVMRDEVTLAVGGTVSFAGVVYPITIPPLPFPLSGRLADPQRLKWRLLLKWGVDCKLMLTTGSGSTQTPPQGGPWRVAEGGVAGMSAITIGAQFTVGRLVPGDRFTVGGEDTLYVVTGSVRAAQNRFETVPITPPLAGGVAVGAPVSFRFASTVTLRAALMQYRAEQVMGAVLTGDRRLIVPNSEFVPPGLAPRDLVSRQIAVLGQSVHIVAATPALLDGEPVAWELQIRG